MNVDNAEGVSKIAVKEVIDAVKKEPMVLRKWIFRVISMMSFRLYSIYALHIKDAFV